MYFKKNTTIIRSDILLDILKLNILKDSNNIKLYIDLLKYIKKEKAIYIVKILYKKWYIKK